jgi:hypothetical protein
MKNDECVIYFITRRNSKQIWKKDKKGWIQKSGRGIMRRATAEQLISHLLPPLTKGTKTYGNVKIVVKMNKKK